MQDKEYRVAAYARVGGEEQLRPQVIGYCRVAQKDRQALESQRQCLLSFCEEKGYDAVLMICETVSGAAEQSFLRRLFHCPKQKGLLIIEKSARKKKIDGVVTMSVSRLTRSTATLVNFVEKLDKNGLFVETVKEGRLFDSFPNLPVCM